MYKYIHIYIYIYINAFIDKYIYILKKGMHEKRRLFRVKRDDVKRNIFMYSYTYTYVYIYIYIYIHKHVHAFIDKYIYILKKGMHEKRRLFRLKRDDVKRKRIELLNRTANNQLFAKAILEGTFYVYL
jgi:hypothetical protein